MPQRCRLPQPGRPSRVLAVGLLAVVALLTPSVGPPWEQPGGSAAAAAQDDATVPDTALDLVPTSAAVGDVITATGSVSGEAGAGSWDFTVPAFVEVLSERANVLELRCRAAGTGPVTATYTSGSGTGHASGDVSCTEDSTAPSSTAPPSTASSPPPGPTPPASAPPVRPSAPPSRPPTGAPTPTTGPQPTGAAPTSGPGPSPTETPRDTLRDEVDEAERHLEPGVVSYRLPASMAEGETEEFVVRVQRDSTPADPTDVPGEGPVVTTPIEVGTPMSARLVGADFDIQPPEARRRVLGSNRPAEWAWTIRPTSFGEKELRLELSVLLEEDSDTALAVRTYVERIDVSVHLRHTGARLATSALGVLSATGLTAAALAGAAWSWWRRRRRRPAGVGVADGPGSPEQAVRRPPPPARAPSRPRRGGRRRRRRR